MQQTIKNGTFTAEYTSADCNGYNIYRKESMIASMDKYVVRVHSLILIDHIKPFADIVTKCGREFLNG